MAPPPPRVAPRRRRGRRRTAAAGSVAPPPPPRTASQRTGPRRAGEEFYIIVKGRVRVFVDLEKKRRRSSFDADDDADAVDFGKQVAILSPGDYFGERAMILNEPRASTCVADPETGVSCLILDREAFEDAVMANKASRRPSAAASAGKKKKSKRMSHHESLKHMLSGLGAYEHDATDEGAGLLGEFITAYADLLPKTSRGEETYEARVLSLARALRRRGTGAQLPRPVVAELKLLSQARARIESAPAAALSAFARRRSVGGARALAGCSRRSRPSCRSTTRWARS